MKTKHLTRKGELLPLHTAVAAYAMNTLASQKSSGFSLFEMVFIQKSPNLLNVSSQPSEQFANTHKVYLQLLKEKHLRTSILLTYKTHQF